MLAKTNEGEYERALFWLSGFHLFLTQTHTKQKKINQAIESKNEMS